MMRDEVGIGVSNILEYDSLFRTAELCECVYNFDLDATLVANCQDGATAMLFNEVVKLATSLLFS